ncbi:MAG: hypothetical protein HYZ28_07485 [Myxococcales bacterium]|nr:hypothetical protein [Myxococcales bacterium]
MSPAWASKEKMGAAPAAKSGRGRLKESAADTLLNAVAILKEVWEDFRSSDRFFKYKAAIIASWVALSTTTFFVACPSAGVSDDIGASLVAREQHGRLAVSVKNESKDTWNDVLVVVNGAYRAVHPPVEPGGMLTVTPKLLATQDGQPPPADLKVVDLEVSTSEGSTTLLKGGLPP